MVRQEDRLGGAPEIPPSPHKFSTKVTLAMRRLRATVTSLRYVDKDVEAPRRSDYSNMDPLRSSSDQVPRSRCPRHPGTLGRAPLASDTFPGHSGNATPPPSARQCGFRFSRLDLGSDQAPEGPGGASMILPLHTKRGLTQVNRPPKIRVEVVRRSANRQDSAHGILGTTPTS